MVTMRRLSALLLLFAACAPRSETPAAPRPSILLVTLDTTRYDAIGADTPNIAAFAKTARRFTQAYCTTPQTLASHGSMMTGLYPAGHGVHENGRYFSDKTPMLAERLKADGYATAAFVSAFAVARRFGLARGFDVYDDDFGPNREQRPADETTDRALAWLARTSAQPRFVWVHYYDPHFPYTPPEPFASRYAGRPYRGEVAFMDQELGRLLKAWPGAVIVVADH